MSDDLHDWELVDVHRRGGYPSMIIGRERAREALLDSYSQPPDESELYGESLIVEGVRIGEQFEPDPFNGDAVAIPAHSDFGFPSGDKTLVEAWHRRSLEEQALLTERQQDELRRIEHGDWATVHAALRQMDKRDREQENARAKYMRVARGTHNLRGWKLKWPFGPPIRYYGGWEKHSIYIAPEPAGWVEPEWPPTEAERWAEVRAYWAAQAKGDEKEMRKQREQREKDNLLRLPPPSPPPRHLQERDPRAPVRITDSKGIEHVIPLEEYERFGREAIPLGVDPPIWVLYRLGFGWHG